MLLIPKKLKDLLLGLAFGFLVIFDVVTIRNSMAWAIGTHSSFLLSISPLLLVLLVIANFYIIDYIMKGLKNEVKKPEPSVPDSTVN